jgi:hypothetical protein
MIKEETYKRKKYTQKKKKSTAMKSIPGQVRKKWR